MSNTIKNLSSGDITKEALSILHNESVFLKTINRQYDNRFAKSGWKNSGQLLIREPNEFTVRTGAAINTQDLLETTQTMTLATQMGVDVNFSSAELTLSLDEFSARILKPAMSRLAAEIQKTVISGVTIDSTFYPGVYSSVNRIENTTFGTRPVYSDIAAARVLLQQGLAPTSDRYFITDALDANAIIASSQALYNPSGAIGKQYETGIMGTLYGMKHLESELAPKHTTGTRTTAGTCDLSGVTNGDTHLSITGTNGETYLIGDIITVAGVYEVNPETKVSTGVLKQFSVGANYTATGSAADMTITWPLYKDGPKQNAYCADWTAASAATVVDLAGSTGTASTTYGNSMAYHKDAFAFVMADLEMPSGVDFAYRANIDGMSMRLVRQYDIASDKFPCRIDVLFGWKCIRPYWAARICS